MNLPCLTLVLPGDTSDSQNSSLWLVLVQPRKIGNCPSMTEILFSGM